MCDLTMDNTKHVIIHYKKDISDEQRIMMESLLNDLACVKMYEPTMFIEDEDEDKPTEQDEERFISCMKDITCNGKIKS